MLLQSSWILIIEKWFKLIFSQKCLIVGWSFCTYIQLCSICESFYVILIIVVMRYFTLCWLKFIIEISQIRLVPMPRSMMLNICRLFLIKSKIVELDFLIHLVKWILLLNIAANNWLWNLWTAEGIRSINFWTKWFIILTYFFGYLFPFLLNSILMRIIIILITSEFSMQFA